MTTPRAKNIEGRTVLRASFGWPVAMYRDIWTLAAKNHRTFRQQVITMVEAALVQEQAHGNTAQVPRMQP